MSEHIPGLRILCKCSVTILCIYKFDEPVITQAWTNRVCVYLTYSKS